MSVETPVRERTVATIDPRVRARRIAVARAAGRRRLHRVLAVVVVVLSLVTGWVVLHSPLVSVQHVEVVGLERLTVPEVVAAGGVRRGQLLVSLDDGRVAAGVATLAPVGKVEVVKRWPRTLRITVQERLPLVAVAQADGATALVDATGRTIEVVASAPAGLLRLSGPVAVGPPGTELPDQAVPALAAAAAVPPSLVAQVVEVRWTAEGGTELALVGGRTAVFGDVATLPEQYVALGTVLAAGGVPEGGTVDVRVPRAPVVLESPCIPGQDPCSP